jgi:uncharacterized protein
VTNMAANLSLAISPDVFVVCKLPANSPFPLWVSERESRSSKFYSITRTDEELSIVCPTEWLPTKDDVDITAENGWRLLKVQGPLDFALTGILASLAKSLAEAGVAIFALSTYDTDYLLVKESALSDAVAALEKAGHSVSSLSSSLSESSPRANSATETAASPRDGPETTKFEADPLVAPLARNEEHETFGLVLVAGWPPRADIRQRYEQFRELIPDCFTAQDMKGAVYLYPSSALHVTVATFRSIHQPTPKAFESVLTRHVQEIVEKAFEAWSSTLPSKESSIVATLTLDRSQLGKRAGILLWKDATGQISSLRSCVQSACQDHLSRLDSMSSSFATIEEINFVRDALRALSIPPILHSTFLRFHQEPQGSASTIQQKFQDEVLRKLPMILSEPLSLSTVALIAERRPYMHIPNDKDHVVSTFPKVNE